MEIAILPKKALKISGKKAAFVFNPEEKITDYNGAFYFQNSDMASSGFKDGVVLIKGPGDFEIAGVKFSGIRMGQENVYSLNIDGIEVLVGNASVIEKLQHKLKEYNIVILAVEDTINASFATSLATNAVLFYGEKAGEVVKAFAKETAKEMNKYQITADKLPVEMETILLQ